MSGSGDDGRDDDSDAFDVIAAVGRAPLVRASLIEFVAAAAILTREDGMRIWFEFAMLREFVGEIGLLVDCGIDPDGAEGGRTDCITRRCSLSTNIRRCSKYASLILVYVLIRAVVSFSMIRLVGAASAAAERAVAAALGGTLATDETGMAEISDDVDDAGNTTCSLTLISEA